MLAISAFVFGLMFASGMSGTVVPLYGASLGASWTEIGLMGTSWGATYMILAIPTGRMSDRFGRKPLLIGSGALSVLAALLYLVSATVFQVILVRGIEGTVSALFWPAVEAFATEIVDPADTGRAMGIATASYGIGYGSGSMAGGAVLGSFGYHWTFACYLALSLISMLVGLLFLHEPLHLSDSKIAGYEKTTLSFRRLPRPLLVAYSLGGMYTFCLGIILTLFSVFAKELGITFFLIGTLFALFWVGRIGGFVAGGRLSDKYGRKPIVIAAMIGSALAFILVATSTGIEPLWEAILILGLGIGAAFPVAIALISDNVSQPLRGYAMGIFEASCAAGAMAAATLGGALADFYSPRAPYILAAIVSLSAAAILALMLHGPNRN
ncbi:MAG TPA: MFS transporter [archaeon]|nr:MFS transporter [archaeon]